MRFRTQSVADAVVERIMAISESVRKGTPLPESKGAATIHMVRSANGDLVVTKTFERGEPELLTISNQAPGGDIPEGFTDVTPANAGQPEDAQAVAPGIDTSGIVENAALGGDAITAILKP